MRPLLTLERAGVLLKVSVRFATEETFQSLRSWSKEVATENIPYMFVTDEGFQFSIGLLKLDACSNILAISETDDMCQFPIG